MEDEAYMSDENEKAEVVEGVPQLDIENVKRLWEKKPEGVHLIDIREDEEYVAGHIPGIPLVPMSEIVDRMDEFKPDQEYVFVCRSGRRSHEVSKYFLFNGFTKVNNFSGGMLTWDGPVDTGHPSPSEE
jgi:rhodanese-related sulfurtransferase